MVVYVPADDATREAMERLVMEYGSGPPRPRFPCWATHEARARELLPQSV